MKTKFLLPLLFLSLSAFATHMRSGEITYKYLGGYTYEIKLTTYTKGSSFQADRCYEEINFGDDTMLYPVCRSNYEAGDPSIDYWGATCTSDSNCTTHHMGEWSMFATCLDIKKNVYSTIHTFPGFGNYAISFNEPNRMDNIINIGSGVPLYIVDTLKINYYVSYGSSPVFFNPAPSVFTVQSGICYTYNSLAVDPDGDSLSYKLISCMDAANNPIAGYWIPAGITVDSITGDLSWCSPAPPNVQSHPDLYSIAIEIKKWRKVSNNFYVVAGTMMRDIQILVEACASMGVNDVNSESQNITISPNPTSGNFNVQMKQFYYVQMKIYNVYGEIIYQSALSNRQSQINISNEPNGIYFLQFKTEYEISNKKIVISK